MLDFKLPFQFRLLLLSLLLFRIMGVLDRQAPDVQVVADSPDDVHDEATMHTNRKAKAHEDESNLVNIIT
jgi:hypothetical protein